MHDETNSTDSALISGNYSAGQPVSQQIYYISVQYFDYDHVTQVEIYRPSVYSPPIMTF